jgi:putative DNA primase/helicase
MNKADALAVLHDAGFLLDAVQWDAGLQRCPTADKPRKKNGAYIAHSDAPASLWWCHWATGQSGAWTETPEKHLSDKERKMLRERIAVGRRAFEEKQAQCRAYAAQRAQSLYASAAVCNGHPYLTTKGVKPVDGLRLQDKLLVIPVQDEAGHIVSLQYIGPDGQKMFLKGGRTAGCFFPIGGKDTDKPLLLCEGLATGLSLNECTGYPVLVAFSSGNLLAVAKIARQKYPKRKIVVCADNDSDRPDNPGLTKASAAAMAVDALLAMPRLPSGERCDFNDVHQAEGLDAAFRQYGNAAKLKASGDRLPPGFELRCGGAQPGLWHVEAKDDGDPVETWVGPPLHVLGLTRDEHGNSWGLLLQWNDPDGRSHTWAMSKSMLVAKDASAWLGRLADEGWCGAPGNAARGRLALYLSTYKTERRILCVPRTGWMQGAFVFPDVTIKNAAARAGHAGHAGQAADDKALNSSGTKPDAPDVLDETIVLQVATPHNPFRMGGSPEGWKNSIGQWARGNSRLALALCASLAGPLLEPSGMESGGFNFVGGSSTGKTTALVAAGSVWGKGAPSGGYIRNWRATSNGLEALAALHSDATLCLDEIGQAPGQTVMEAAYMLANGMGKARAFADGSAKAAKTWRSIVLSTGEKGLAEKIAEEGGRIQAGQTVRLVDVPADAGAGFGLFEELHGSTSAQAFADGIRGSAAVHYGHTARLFIEGFINNREEATRALHEAFANHQFCPADADGQVKRVARRFLLCAVAGELASAWGLLPWEKGEALVSVKKCLAIVVLYVDLPC